MDVHAQKNAGRVKDDLVAPGDIPAAIGLLTRLPVRVDGARAMARGARAAWAWPLAGALVAALAGMGGVAALWLGLPALVAAGVVVALQAMMTGAMHEDGLADCADGFWGGWTPDRRLAIMKDSRTGAYGVVALVLVLGLRVATLAALMAAGPWWTALVALGAISRVPMAALQAILRPARPGGLSDRAGRPPMATVRLAVLLACVIGLAGAGVAALAVAAVVALVTLLWGVTARAKIGGQTGDVLGAGQQLAELAGLMALVAVA
jgi:adenosylcobinamide-GDP ribazoletransferase